MCERTDGANSVREAAMCLVKACFDSTPKSYRDHLEDTIREELPDWAKDLLKKMK